MKVATVLSLLVAIIALLAVNTLALRRTYPTIAAERLKYKVPVQQTAVMDEEEFDRWDTSSMCEHILSKEMCEQVYRGGFTDAKCTWGTYTPRTHGWMVAFPRLGCH